MSLQAIELQNIPGNEERQVEHEQHFSPFYRSYTAATRIASYHARICSIEVSHRKYISEQIHPFRSKQTKLLIAIYKIHHFSLKNIHSNLWINIQHYPFFHFLMFTSSKE